MSPSDARYLLMMPPELTGPSPTGSIRHSFWAVKRATQTVMPCSVRRASGGRSSEPGLDCGRTRLGHSDVKVDGTHEILR